MESILEFMYIGMTTIHHERMNEFLNVAKNLEIKEIAKVVEFEDGYMSSGEPDLSENMVTTGLVNEIKGNTISDSQILGNADGMFDLSENKVNTGLVNETKGNTISDSQVQMNRDGMFECDQCEGQYSMKKTLTSKKAYSVKT